MRGLKIVVFLLGVLTLSSQLFRHAYVRWVESRHSVLQKYETPVHDEVRDAASLAELERRYGEELALARAEVAKRPPPSPDHDDFLTPDQRAQDDPRVSALKSAIQDWERLNNELRELRFYWFCGLASLSLAAAAFWRRWAWPAIALVILGFAEMLWATCPSFSGDLDHQFNTLVNAKILYTVASLVLLFGFWVVGWLRAESDLRAQAG